MVTRSWVKEGENVWFLDSIREDPIVFFHDGQIGDGHTIGRDPRKHRKDSLGSQWDYFWESETKRLYVFSISLPSTLATSLEYGVRQSYTDIIRTDGVSINGISFYGARGRGIGILAFRNSGPVIRNLRITNCFFGPSGGQHVQFNGAVGTLRGNVFVDWNIEGVEKYYAWQGIAAHGMNWSSGTVIKDNYFFLTISRPTRREGELIDSGPITADEGYWASEISGNRIYLNGLGAGILVFRPSHVASTMLIERNVVIGSNSMALDLSDFVALEADTAVVARKNWFENSNLDDIPDTEVVRFRGIGGTARINFHSNIVERSCAGRNSHPGIGIENVTTYVKIAQNTIYDTDIGIEFKGLGNQLLPVSIVNNMILKSRIRAVEMGPFAIEQFAHNLFFGNAEEIIPQLDTRPSLPMGYWAIHGQRTSTDRNSPARWSRGILGAALKDFQGRCCAGTIMHA